VGENGEERLMIQRGLVELGRRQLRILDRAGLETLVER
jgi:hypothetical protein